jgi:hypothetical protein
MGSTWQIESVDLVGSSASNFVESARVCAQ